MPEMVQHPIIPIQKPTFEKITPAHCHVLAALHQTSFEKPWSAIEFEKILSHSNTHGLIAVDMQLTPLGFILVRSVIEEAEILTFCVDPQYRSQKIATEVLKSIMTSYKTQRITRIFLEVAEDNPSAINLYQKCGFTTVGERPGYYATRNKMAKNAIIMAYSLR